eukprot:2064686-Pleurochrysis_carterae.AAC.5
MRTASHAGDGDFSRNAAAKRAQIAKTPPKNTSAERPACLLPDGTYRGTYRLRKLMNRPDYNCGICSGIKVAALAQGVPQCLLPNVRYLQQGRTRNAAHVCGHMGACAHHLRYEAVFLFLCKRRSAKRSSHGLSINI